MNNYVTLARRYWETYRPQELSAMEDPEKFFTELGKEVDETVTSQTQALLAARIPAGGPEEQAGLIAQARQMAEERALAELVFLPPEPGRERQEMPPL